MLLILVSVLFSACATEQVKTVEQPNVSTSEPLPPSKAMIETNPDIDNDKVLNVDDNCKSSYNPKDSVNSVPDWASSYENDWNFDSANGVGVDVEGNIYITDKENNRIKVLSSSGSLLKTFDVAGRPDKIVVDDSGNFFVSFPSSNKVEKHGKNGELLLKITKGEASEDLSSPIGLALSKDKLYVVDSEKSRVQVFNLDGAFISAFGGFEEKPQSIEVDSDGNLYVTDFVSGVYVFKDSNLLYKINKLGRFQGQFNSPRGVAVDSLNNVYVVDYSNNRIQVLSRDLSFVREFSKIDNYYNLRSPIDITVDKNDDIYVVSSSDVNKFRLAQSDKDDDGVGDVCDNCPGLSNPNQEDSNNNRVGNACENQPEKVRAN